MVAALEMVLFERQATNQGDQGAALRPALALRDVFTIYSMCEDPFPLSVRSSTLFRWSSVPRMTYCWITRVEVVYNHLAGHGSG